ncbi:MAG: hypothetical protein ABWY16_02565 [Pedobacter sp.]|uniref:hypothetical protein n=1 Tax=Pedobacter sp. TaxID=1411316 RepID=UPI00339854A7
MSRNSGTSKIWKWIAGIIIVLIAIVASISIYFSIRWKPVLTQKIKDVVYNGSEHMYSLNFKDIHLNLLTGSVTVDSILLAPDTAVFNARKKSGTAPTHLFQVKLEKLQLRRISILTIYFRKKIEMNDIILKHPSINMIYNKVYKKPTPVKDRRSLYERISKILKSVHIKGIKIEDADFDYVSGATGQLLNSVKHLNVHVKDLLLDEHSKSDTTRFYYTKDISFEMTGYSSLSKDKMYTMKVDTITGSAIGKTVHVKGFKMIPMYPEIQFSKMLKTQKDRYNLAFDQIDFRGVNFYRLNIRGILQAKALRIKNGNAKVFMNREMPPGHGDKSGNFPHMALKRLPVETTVDTLQLRGVNVAYTEYNPISQEKGTVHIDRLTGNIYNVTNDSTSLSKNRYAVAELDAYMIRAAQLHIRINFDLLAKNAAFTFKGNIGKMDMVKLNPLSKALGLVTIESGQIQKIDFDVKANAKGSRGTMHMYYNNLKIELLKEGEDGKPAKKKGLLSFLANTLIVKDENPSKGKPVRTADIVFDRPPGASFFNLLWKSVFIGMRETVGLGIVPMKTPEEGRRVVVEKLRERKEKRQEKRAEKKAGKEKN